MSTPFPLSPDVCYVIMALHVAITGPSPPTLGFLAPADNRFDQSRSSGAGVAHCRWYLLLRGSLIVDWLCLDFLLWCSLLACRFSWFTLLGYIGTHQHGRRRAAAASRTFLSVGCFIVCFGVRIPGGTLPLAMCLVLQKHWPQHNTTQPL